MSFTFLAPSTFKITFLMLNWPSPFPKGPCWLPRLALTRSLPSSLVLTSLIPKAVLWKKIIIILSFTLLENQGSVQFSSVAQSCPTLCDPMDCSTAGLPVHHQLTEFTQTHVRWVGDAIQPSHPLSSPSPPSFYLSQHQGLFKWVSSSHQVDKILEFQV